MIRTIAFQNFKALRHVIIDLSPFTLIVGPNASGKTSMLEGLHYLARLGETPPEELFRDDNEPNRLRSAGASDAMLLGITGEWQGTEGSLFLGAAPSRRESWQFDLEGKWDGADVPLRRSKELGPWLYRPPHEPLRDAIGSAALLYLDPGAISRPSYSEEITLRVHHDGSNVAAVLADLAVSDPSAFQRLRERLQAVVPSVKELRLQRAKIEKTEFEPVEVHGERYFQEVRTKAVGHQIVLDFLTADGLDAELASEGTLLTLGLLTILSVPSRPRLVLVDELERALHPKALGELVRQIRELQKQFRGLQVIGTTHSPYLVDHFDASEVILTALREDGSVVAGGLHEHPEFGRWKDEMKPGEFWSTVGEDWLKDKKGEEGE